MMAVVRTRTQVVYTSPGEPLAYEKRPISDPQPGEILVRTTIAGICGTDLHRLQGHIHDSHGPVCFGHEGIGVVEALGAGVETDLAGTRLQVGDRVQWSPIAPCNRCYGCVVAHDPVTCTNRVWPSPAAQPNAATYQELAMIPPNGAIYRLAEDVNADDAAAFGCAMPTALGGMARLGEIKPGSIVVIQGCGPVGLASTVLTGLSRASEVIVIGDPPLRLSVAQRLGATRTIKLSDTTATERREQVLELSGGRGADVVIEATGHRSAIDEGLHLLGRNGRYLVMGLYSGDGVMPVDLVRLNNMSQRIIGTLAHQLGDLLHASEIAARYGKELGFSKLITQRFPLLQTEAAIRAVADENAIKVVIDMSPGFEISPARSA